MITNTEQAKATGWEVHGDPDVWELVCKAQNDDLGITKSTKRMRIGARGACGGWLYQVSTITPSGAAEALAYVPDAE